MRSFLHSKIHRARVTRVELDYVGSCALDEDLMEAARIAPFEQIHIWNVNNGERFITYAIPATRGSGTISVNGSAARRVQLNDVLIIATFILVNADEAGNVSPTVVFVDGSNRPTDHPV